MLPALGRPHVLHWHVGLKNRNPLLQGKLSPRLGNTLLPEGEDIGARLENNPSQTHAAGVRQAVVNNSVFAHNARHHLVANHQIRRLKRRETDRQGVPMSHDKHPRRDTHENCMANGGVCIRNRWNNPERLPTGICHCGRFRRA